MKVRKLNPNSLIFKIKYFLFKRKHRCKNCRFRFYEYACFVGNNNCLKELL